MTAQHDEHGPDIAPTNAENSNGTDHGSLIRRDVVKVVATSGRGQRPLLQRRSLLGLGAAATASLALGSAGRQAIASQSSELRPLTLAWNASAICTASAPTAQEEGIFEANGLNVEFVNFGGSTEALLEAIATGKADAGVGMTLRWLKPME